LENAWMVDAGAVGENFSCPGVSDGLGGRALLIEKPGRPCAKWWKNRRSRVAAVCMQQKAPSEVRRARDEKTAPV